MTSSMILLATWQMILSRSVVMRQLEKELKQMGLEIWSVIICLRRAKVSVYGVNYTKL